MINYKQLFYFWQINKFGSITRAADALHLTPQTISGQLAELERSLGITLFNRIGRKLEITAAGKLVNSQADAIFQIGQELEQSIRNGATTEEPLFRVGIADAVPKSIAYQLLAPVLQLANPVRLICFEDKLERLFAEVAIHQLDLVIADRPLHSDLGIKGYNHELGQSAISLFAAPELASRLRPQFPLSLDKAPLLLPGDKAAMQIPITQWLKSLNITPQIVGKFDDSALMKAFGKAGAGAFPAPAILSEEVSAQYNVDCIGSIPNVSVRYYAISIERRLRHPAVVAVCDAAKRSLFH